MENRRGELNDVQKTEVYALITEIAKRLLSVQKQLGKAADELTKVFDTCSKCSKIPRETVKDLTDRLKVFELGQIQTSQIISDIDKSFVAFETKQKITHEEIKDLNQSFGFILSRIESLETSLLDNSLSSKVDTLF
jgi:hypothetical protein